MQFSGPNSVIEVSPRIGGANNSRLLNMSISGNSMASYTVYMDGGHELTTYHTSNNDTSIAKIQYRPVTNNVAVWDCEPVIDATGNTIWSYAGSNRFESQLYTQTYTDGAQIVTIQNRAVTLNLAQSTTFFITPGEFFPDLRNHFINTFQFIVPNNTSDQITIGCNLILANVWNVTTTAWRNAGVFWPNGEVPPSTHSNYSIDACGDIDVYSLMNIRNLRDYYTTNNYTISLVNPGGEFGNTYGWTGNRGFTSSNTSIIPSGSGSYSFQFTDPSAVYSGNYTGSALQTLYFDTGNGALIGDIDSGKANVNIGWYQRGYNYSYVSGGLGLRFYAANGTLISAITSSLINPSDTSFSYRSITGVIPAGARRVDVEMLARKTNGWWRIQTYFDDIQPIKIERFWNTANAPKTAANTVQNNVWYGFAPYLKKRFSWNTAVDVCMFLRYRDAPAWYTIAAEWWKHRLLWPNRKFHFICINNDLNTPNPVYPLPYNLNDEDINAVPPSVHYVDTCEGDPNKTTDWFSMLGLEDEVCYGGYVRMFGRIDVPSLWGNELLNSYSSGENIRRLVLECKKYNIFVTGGTTTSGGGDTSINALTGTGIAGLGGVLLNDYV